MRRPACAWWAGTGAFFWPVPRRVIYNFANILLGEIYVACSFGMLPSQGAASKPGPHRMKLMPDGSRYHLFPTKPHGGLDSALEDPVVFPEDEQSQFVADKEAKEADGDLHSRDLPHQAVLA